MEPLPGTETLMYGHIVWLVKGLCRYLGGCGLFVGEIPRASPIAG